MNEEEINTITIGFVGPASSGKSSLLGILLYKLGKLSDDVIRSARDFGIMCNLRYRGQLPFEATVDRLNDERMRGTTLRISSYMCEVDGRSMSLLNLPSYTEYYRSRYRTTDRGISMSEYCVYVFNIDRYKSYSSDSKLFDLDSQLMERMLGFGVRKVIVAISKMDEVNWSEVKYEEISHRLMVCMRKVGWKDEQIEFVPVSGALGDNIIVKSKNMEWYKGKSLVEMFSSLPSLAPVSLDLPLRASVFGTIRIQGLGFVVRCKILSGLMKVGERVHIDGVKEVGYEKVYHRDVMDMEWYGQKREVSSRGMIVGVLVSEHTNWIRMVRSGMIITDEAGRLEGANVLEIEGRTLHTLKIGGHALLQMHSDMVRCVIEGIEPIEDCMEEGEQEEEEKIKSVRIVARMERAAFVDTREGCPCMSRLIMRVGEKVVFWGVVVRIIE